MSLRELQLAQRRSVLRARAAVQRNHLAQTATQIEAQLGSVDRGVRFARGVLRSPVLLVGGIALVAFIGPRRLLRIASRGLVLLTTTRRVMRLVQEKRGMLR